MAKLERDLSGSFDRLLDYLHDGILSGSSSASWEDSSDYRSGSFRVAVRVYERYSFMGGNRVSLNLTLVGNGPRLFLSACSRKHCISIFPPRPAHAPALRLTVFVRPRKKNGLVSSTARVLQAENHNTCLRRKVP